MDHHGVAVDGGRRRQELGEGAFQPGDREGLWGDAAQAGLVGAERFLLKVERFVADAREAIGTRQVDPETRFDPADLSESERDAYRKLHETIAKIDRDFEALQLNTHTAAVMELAGALGTGTDIRPELRFVCAAAIVRLLAPLTPHLAEEWWEVLGFGPTVFRAGWPRVDQAALPAATMVIAVQVNGRLRGQVTVASDAPESDIVAAAEADPKIAPHLQGARIKQIYVPGRVLNFVVKPAK